MNRCALVLVVFSLTGCPKKEDTSPPSAADAGAALAPVVPASFDRYFRGTIGDGLGVSMHLTKKVTALEGTYAYDSTKHDIALAGAMTDATTFTMTETVEGRTTGKFKGAVAADGSLTGTWSDASGAKSLPFTLHEDAAPKASAQVPPAAPPARTAIAPATDNEMAAFLVRFAQWKKAPGSGATAAEALEDYNDLRLRKVTAFREKYGLPILSSSFFVVYVADANNDGIADYVLTSRNDVGLHNDDIMGVFTPKEPKETGFEEQTLPKTGPLGPNRVQFFGKVFLSRDAEGVTMTFAERKVDKRYLWKGDKLTSI